jgi:mannose-6-phosphate isomerase-like protein (cupin superfamily)
MNDPTFSYYGYRAPSITPYGIPGYSQLPQPFYSHSFFAHPNLPWGAPCFGRPSPPPANPYAPAHWLRSETEAKPIRLKDYGPAPFVVNIEEASVQNRTFRTALWTGKHFQVTVMSIDVGEDIGLEVHPHTDQFIRIEQGQGLMQMGDAKDRLDFEREVKKDDAVMIPAGTWHNLINTGNTPLKVYVIYAPPEHPHGTVHKTKADALAAEQKSR